MALLLSLSLFLFLARIGQPPHYAAYPSWPVIKAVSHFYETKKRELSNKYIYPSLWGDGEQRSRSGVVHLLNVEIYIRDGNFFFSLPLVSRKLSARRSSTDRRDTQNRCILMARARLPPPPHLRMTQLSFSRRACIINHPFKTFVYPSFHSIDGQWQVNWKINGWY